MWSTSNSKGTDEGAADSEDRDQIPKSRRKRRADSRSLSSSSSTDNIGTTENDQEEAWPESMHRTLVEAIFELGLKNASPAAVMEKMQLTTDNITSEQVKSHLQKYRNNKEKNKEEFMREYDDWLLNAQTETAIIPRPPLERYHGGERAAYLTYLVMQEEQQHAATASPQTEPPSAADAPHCDHILSFPAHSQEEQREPLGKTKN